MIALLCLAFYLASTSPLIYWRDSVEFAMIGHNLDIGHPAGSPTFSMFAKLLDFFPFGAVCFRATLFSVFCAVGAMTVLAFILFRLAQAFKLDTVKSFLGSLTAVSALAFSPAFFDWTVAPEVYSAQVLAVFVVLALAFELNIGEHRGGADRRLLFLAGLILGLGCGVHMGTGLLAPGLAWALIMPNRSLRKLREMSIFGLFVLIGFSVYIYLPIRSATQPVFDQGNPQSWPLFLMHITGSRYSEIIHSFPWPRIFHNLRALAEHFSGQLTLPVIPLAVFGLLFAAKRSPHYIIAIFLFVLGHLYLYVKDWEKAFGYIPVFALAALLAGMGVVAAIHFLRGKRRFFDARIGVAACALFAALLFSFQAERAIMERSHAAHDLAHNHMRALLDSLPHDALYVSHQDANSYTIFYAQSVERYREDVVHIQRAFLPLPEYVAQRYPFIDWTNYDPGKPYGVYEFLLANREKHEPFWDYGWETRPDVPTEGIFPYGFIWRVDEKSAGAPATDDHVYEKYFSYNEAQMEHHPYDFTAREVYARRFSLLAKYFYDRRMFGDADRAINHALEIRPDFGQFYAQLGIVQSAQKMKDQAWLNGVLATQLEPMNEQNWNYRALFALRNDDSDDAAASYEKSLTFNRWQSGPAASLAEILVSRGQYAPAQSRARDARKGAKTDDEMLRADNALARALVGLNRCAEALPILESIRSRNSGNETTAKLLDFCRQKLK